MGKKQILSGLRQRNGVWHIEKMVNGTRLYESTGVSESQKQKNIDVSLGRFVPQKYLALDHSARFRKRHPLFNGKSTET